MTMRYWNYDKDEQGRETKTLIRRCNMCNTATSRDWDLWTAFSCNEWTHDYCPKCSSRILAYLNCAYQETETERFWKIRQRNTLYGKFDKLTEEVMKDLKVEDLKREDEL